MMLAPSHPQPCFALLWHVVLATCLGLGAAAAPSATLVRKSLETPGTAAHPAVAGQAPSPVYFKASLARVASYLPRQLTMGSDPRRIAAYHSHFAVYRPARTQAENSFKALGQLKGKSIAKLFVAGVKYTYVITADQFIFTRIKPVGVRKGYSKHFVVNNFQPAVRYAGECWVDEHGNFTIDNNSGTFKPTPDLLQRVAGLLSHNFELAVNTAVHRPTPK